MSGTNVTTIRVVPSVSELKRTGFSKAQIRRLKELRSMYPLLEFIETPKQARWMEFLKWRYTTGRINEERR